MGFGFSIALTVALWLVLLIWLRRLIVRRLAPDRILRDLRSEVSELTKEINRVGDQHATVVEDRITTLKSLLAQAENLIDEGQVLLRRLEAHVEPVIEQEAVRVEETLSPNIRADDPRRSVEQLYRQGVGAEIIASRLGIAIGEVELMISLLEQRTR